MQKYKFSQEEINEIKREYREEHTIIGTENEPVILNDRVAICVLTSRKRLEEYLNSIHSSHNMKDWTTKILAPAGTARFYSYRECKDCGGAQYYHTAGRFIDPELKRGCIK